MGDFFDKVEGWFKHPIQNDLSPLNVIALVIVIVAVAVWSQDGINIIKKGLSQ